MKQIECKIHPKQAITNFCKHSQCYLPLCPECVVVHTAFHREKNWHGYFDTLENTYSFCDSKLEAFENRYSHIESLLSNTIKSQASSEEDFYSRLDEMKNSLIKEIEDIFDGLKRDGSRVLKEMSQGMQHDFESIMRELQQMKEEMSEKRRELENATTRTIIELYSTEFVIRHCHFQREIKEFDQHLRDQSLLIELNTHACKEIQRILRDRLVIYRRKGDEIALKTRNFVSPERKIPNNFLFTSPLMARSPQISRILRSPIMKSEFL